MLLFLMGCKGRAYHALHPEPVYLSKTATFALISPNEWAPTLESQTLMQATYASKNYTFQFVLSMTTSNITVLGLTDTGQELFRLGYEQDHLSFSSLIPKNRLKPEYLLADIELAYFPIEILNDRLHASGLTLIVSDNKRLIYEGTAPIITIDFSPPTDNATGARPLMIYTHHMHGYTYSIFDLESPL